jgi:hypothetical protein
MGSGAAVFVLCMPAALVGPVIVKILCIH